MPHKPRCPRTCRHLPDKDWHKAEKSDIFDTANQDSGEAFWHSTVGWVIELDNIAVVETVLGTHGSVWTQQRANQLHEEHNVGDR